MAIEWVTLADLKNDQGLDTQVTSRDDQALQRALDAAVSWVSAHRPDLYYAGPTSVPADVRLGTLRLAAHWSGHSAVDLGELGSGGSSPRIPADVYALLGIRR